MKLTNSNPGQRGGCQSVAADVSRLKFFGGRSGLTSAATSRSGFTMVEIALCLAIVGFALVAIIGVLPAGLNVQKENREETIINQEASIWMDALRSGSVGYDQLTQYVDRITVATNLYAANGTLISTGTNTYDGPFANGGVIVGLLSTPRFSPGPQANTYVVNTPAAFVRALSGNAADKPPQDNLDVRDLSFSYRLVVENTQAGAFDLAGVLTNQTDAVLQRNLTDVRLLFRWPLKRPYQVGQPDPAVGNSRLVFRTQISGGLLLGGHSSISAPLYFRQPRNYQP